MIAQNTHETEQSSVDPTELLMVGDLAHRRRISIRQTWKLKAEGSLPKPIRLGRSVRWRASDIAEWVAAGCPVKRQQ